MGKATDPGKAAFRSHVRTIQRLAQELQRVARRKGEAAAENLPLVQQVIGR